MDVCPKLRPFSYKQKGPFLQLSARVKFSDCLLDWRKLEKTCKIVLHPAGNFSFRIQHTHSNPYLTERDRMNGSTLWCVRFSKVDGKIGDRFLVFGKQTYTREAAAIVFKIFRSITLQENTCCCPCPCCPCIFLKSYGTKDLENNCRCFSSIKIGEFQQTIDQYL